MVRAAVQKGEEAVPGVKGEIHITGDRPPVETHRESRLLKMLAESVETVTGRKAEVSSFPGYTDTAGSGRDDRKQKLYVLWTGQPCSGA